MEPEAHRLPASSAHTDTALVCFCISSGYMGRISILVRNLMQLNMILRLYVEVSGNSEQHGD